MSRAVTIGNGNMLIGLDAYGQVRDLYFPYAGHSDHVSGASGSYVHRIGVMADGVLAWLSDGSWSIDTGCNDSSSVSTICARNDARGIEMTITDVVHNEKNIFLRRVELENKRDESREVKIFFGQEFRISESRRGDTAFFDPRVNAIIHYKGHVAFLINAETEGKQFSEYSVGLFDIEGKQGSYADAEDGVLSKNPIEHGSVDSVIGLTCSINGGAKIVVYYWITAAETIEATHKLDTYVKKETPERLIASTEHYWHAWVGKESRDLTGLNDELQRLYRRSLAIIRVHADNRGGIIASSDSDMLNHGRDTYSYVWPRDAAVAAHALDLGGYSDVSQRFFTFMANRIEKDGFLMHKYRVDGVLGSSWHPWIQDGEAALPIQEDETAIVLYMLYRHYECARDLEFIESLYNPFIEPASDFMCRYIDTETGLPQGSYDLWEEKFGTSTYTVSAVYGALTAAAELSALLGKRHHARKYRDRAELFRRALLAYLYDTKAGTFIKHIRHRNGKLEHDATVDISSVRGPVLFGVLSADDKRVQSSFDLMRQKLAVPTSLGGFMRYENDGYYRISHSAPPNPWCITTLWVAQQYISCAKKESELAPAHELLEWVKDRAAQSGVLPEQVHPYTGEHLSTAPLVWSHAEFVITCQAYIRKYRELR